MRAAVGTLLRMVTALAIVVASSVGFAPPARAQITGGCSATIDGADVGSAQSVRSAIPVDQNATVEVTGTAPGPITAYHVYLSFAGLRFPAGDGTVSNGDTTYRTTVEVSKYASYGVGLYRVEGDTDGTVCTGWAYVKVTGRNPLTTAAGIAGAALTGLGLLGLLSSIPRRVRGVGAPTAGPPATMGPPPVGGPPPMGGQQ